MFRLFALAGILTIASYRDGIAGILSSDHLQHTMPAASPHHVHLLSSSPDTEGDTLLSKALKSGAEFINIPNVFTPDGDGINDYFTIANSGLKEYRIEIYDRWGLLVFESGSTLLDWDGRSTSGVIMSEGTYFFILKAISLDAVDYSTTGFLSLFRGK